MDISTELPRAEYTKYFIENSKGEWLCQFEDVEVWTTNPYRAWALDGFDIHLAESLRKYCWDGITRPGGGGGTAALLVALFQKDGMLRRCKVTEQIFTFGIHEFKKQMETSFMTQLITGESFYDIRKEWR